MAITNAKCCCCVNLRIGTIVIGVLLLIIHGLQAIISILNIDDLPHDQQNVTVALQVTYYSSIAVSVISFVLDALLISGVSSSRPALVFVWLCWGIPICVLTTMGCAVVTIFMTYATVQNYDGAPFYLSVSGVLLLSSAVLVYWTRVVLLYYREMMATERQVAAARAPIRAYVQTSPSMYQQQANPMGCQQLTPAVGNQQPSNPLSNQQGGESPVCRY